MVTAKFLLLLLDGLFVCFYIGSFYDGGFASFAKSALIAIWFEPLLRHVDKQFFLLLFFVRDRLVLLLAADCVSLPLYGYGSLLGDVLLELHQSIGPLFEGSGVSLRRRCLCFYQD